MCILSSCSLQALHIISFLSSLNSSHNLRLVLFKLFLQPPSAPFQTLHTTSCFTSLDSPHNLLKKSFLVFFFPKNKCLLVTAFSSSTGRELDEAHRQPITGWPGVWYPTVERSETVRKTQLERQPRVPSLSEEPDPDLQAPRRRYRAGQ